MKVIEKDLKTIELDDKLKHLTIEQINEVINKYYEEGTKVNDLIREYSINVNNGSFYKVLPPIVTDESCNICGGTIVKDRGSKTSQFGYKYCYSCKHEEKFYCSCFYCTKKREEERNNEVAAKQKEDDMYKEKVDNFLSSLYIPPVEEDDLSLEDILFLSVFMRAAMNEEMSYLTPFENVSDSIYPNEETTVEMIRHLIARKLLVLSPTTPYTGFSKDEFPAYYIFKVHYKVNVKPNDGDYESCLNRLLYPSRDLFESDKEFCYQMWRKLALDECLEYLNYNMIKVNFDFNPGKKTISVFNHLLDNFSVAQIYGIIYSSVSFAARAYQEGKYTKKHAANLVISYCESRGVKAINENWDLTHYRRNYDLPQSIFYQVLFGYILQLGELGFVEVPTEKF